MTAKARVTIAEDQVLICFMPGDPVQTRAVDCVVDFDDFGVPLGVEVLDFRRQLGKDSPPESGVDVPSWSYDVEMDALYLRMRAGGAPRQGKVVGTATRDSRGRLLNLVVSL
ncbi:MAG TPA: hypothetical protein VFC09_01420 [Candidatus Dormibacteraeota bacterium]|nr:hypothetical protein [Candidatus Dormibacteraeota bacterium]